MPLMNPKRPCPICGAIVPNFKPIGKPHVCPGCGAELQLSNAQLNARALIVAAVCVLSVWLLGFRGWRLVWLSLLAYIPVTAALTPVFILVWPARLEPYDGHRIWG